MRVFSKITSDNLERREVHLTILTCSAIAILGIGLAALMYPVVFSAQVLDRFQYVIFVGFCVLCVLFAMYVWDRHRIIRHLRRQLDLSHKLVAHVQAHANMELLSALPDFELFQDCLPMELRRAAASLNELSVLVVSLSLKPDVTSSEGTAVFSTAAKDLSRKLRQQDSIYKLTPACLGIVLPNIDMAGATRISECMADGLSKTPGAGSKFSHTISIVNYPTHALSASKLLQVVQTLMPEEKFDRLQSEATRGAH